MTEGCNHLFPGFITLMLTGYKCKTFQMDRDDEKHRICNHRITENLNKGICTYCTLKKKINPHCWLIYSCIWRPKTCSIFVKLWDFLIYLRCTLLPACCHPCSSERWCRNLEATQGKIYIKRQIIYVYFSVQSADILKYWQHVFTPQHNVRDWNFI